MTALVFGGAASGKSEYGEKLVCSLPRTGELIYLATMEPFGPEAEARIRRHRELAEDGYTLLAAGEMGIGNTTTTAAVACALLGLSPQAAVGRGAGLSDTGLERKRRAVERALEVNRPDPGDPVDILCKVGGLDIAAMTGFYLGCAAAQVPVILDGAISAAAALLAVRLCPNAEKALLPSHWPSEPCGQALLAALGLVAQSVYRDMSTFGGMGIGAYRPDGERVPAKVGPEDTP